MCWHRLMHCRPEWSLLPWLLFVPWILSRPQQPGPYLSPPTLALLIAQLEVDATACGVILLAAIFGFG